MVPSRFVLDQSGKAWVDAENAVARIEEMERQLDDVAYVRFASVYKNFRETKDFEALIGEADAARDRGAVEAEARRRILEGHMLAGVTVVDDRPERAAEPVEG